MVDRGNDWPTEVDATLKTFGEEMWCFREADRPTTRALNLYTGEHRGASRLLQLPRARPSSVRRGAELTVSYLLPAFDISSVSLTSKPAPYVVCPPRPPSLSSPFADFKYLGERTRLEPIDLPTPLRTSNFLHFVCSPTRSLVIHSQLLPPLNTTPTWTPSLVFEPIPDRCIPEELPSLQKILPHIAVFSPNHEEAWSFFGVDVEEVAKRGKEGIEEVARKFYEEGAGGDVVIRSGALGAYAIEKGQEKGVWVPAYHSYESTGKVLDVTGAGNSFLVSTSTLVSPEYDLIVSLSQQGGLMAGLQLYPGDLVRAVRMGSISVRNKADHGLQKSKLTFICSHRRPSSLSNSASPQSRRTAKVSSDGTGFCHQIDSQKWRQRLAVDSREPIEQFCTVESRASFVAELDESCGSIAKDHLTARRRSIERTTLQQAFHKPTYHTKHPPFCFSAPHTIFTPYQLPSSRDLQQTALLEL